MNNFKYAAKKQLRFPFRGMISVEDLFNLSLVDLDSIYKSLKKQQKNSAEESLIEKTVQDTELEVKLAIVKEIFDDKKAAQDKAKKAMEKKAKAQRILEIMSKKQDEALQNMSEDELKAQLAELTADDEEEE
jgi:hypothetical protein